MPPAFAFTRLHLAMVQRSEGGSCVRRSAYQSAESLMDERTGEAHDYRAKAPEIVATGIMLPANAPAWAADRATLWTKAEAAERRCDAQTGRVWDFAIPRELPPSEWQDFTRHLLAPHVEQGMAIDYAIHNEVASDGLPQPHVSALATVRPFDGDGFAAKKDPSWNATFADFAKAKGIKGLPKGNHAQDYRTQFADRANDYLAAHGHDFRVSLASNEDRGLPPPKPILSKPRVRQLQRVDAEIRAVDAQIIDLTAERDRRRPQPRQPQARTWRDFVTDARAQAAAATAAARAVQVPARGYARVPRDTAQIVSDRRQQESDRVDLIRHNATRLTELRQQGHGWNWLFHPWRTAAQHQQRLEGEQYAQQALTEAEQRQADTERWLDGEGGQAWARRKTAAERRAWDNAHGPADRAERQINRHEQQAAKLARVADSVEAAAEALADPRIDEETKAMAARHLREVAQHTPEDVPKHLLDSIKSVAGLPAAYDQVEQGVAMSRLMQTDAQAAAPAAPAPPPPAA